MSVPQALSLVRCVVDARARWPMSSGVMCSRRLAQQVREAVVGVQEAEVQVRHQREELGLLRRARQAVGDDHVVDALQERVDLEQLLLVDAPLAHRGLLEQPSRPRAA